MRSRKLPAFAPLPLPLRLPWVLCLVADACLVSASLSRGVVVHRCELGKFHAEYLTSTRLYPVRQAAFCLARLWGSFHVPARAPIPCPTPSRPYKPYAVVVPSSFTTHLLHCPSPSSSLSAAIERACPLYLGTSPRRVPMAPSTTPSGMSKTTCSLRSRLRLPIEVCIVPYIFLYIEQAHSTSRRYLLRD